MFLLLITSRIAIRLFSFNKILLFIKKLAFDGFYPLLVYCALKKSIFVVFKIAIRLFSFNKILLLIKKLAFDGFYPLLVV